MDPSRPPWIKICGNLRAEDAHLVASFRPDFMGWIFSPFSVRRIDRVKAARLIRSIRQRDPAIRHVGVFAGNPLLWILQTDRRLRLADAPLDFLQITEGAGFITLLRERMKNTGHEPPTPVIPVIRPTARLDDQLFLSTSPSPFWILDRFDPQAKGGTGQRIPVEFFNAEHPVRFPFLIAGGIRPENAVAALRESGAIGIDVSSGLEARPGVKDPARVESLFRALRE